MAWKRVYDHRGVHHYDFKTISGRFLNTTVNPFRTSVWALRLPRERRTNIYDRDVDRLVWQGRVG